MLKYIIGLTLGITTLTTPIKANSLNDLIKVQKIVNQNVRFELERKGQDVWRLPVNFNYGDCEDFALLKRQLLIKRGWDSNDLILIMVYKKKQNSNTITDGHIALLVKSQNLVLDSIQSEGSKNVKIVTMQSYLQSNNFILRCYVKNIDTTKKFNAASDRC